MKPPRRVESEWLDALPADDPRAIRSRRDLRRVNAWMLQTGIMTRALIAQCASERPRTLIDLGAGDGTFMLAVAQQLATRWQDVAVILLDRQDIVSENTRAAFRALQWQLETVAMDVFDFLERLSPASVDIIITNLFLHHFQQEQLTR